MSKTKFQFALMTFAKKFIIINILVVFDKHYCLNNFTLDEVTLFTRVYALCYSASGIPMNSPTSSSQEDCVLLSLH